MDPKRHYRAPDSTKFPKHFQVQFVLYTFSAPFYVGSRCINLKVDSGTEKEGLLRCTLLVACSDWNGGGGCSRVLLCAPQQEGAQADHSFVVLFCFVLRLGQWWVQQSSIRRASARRSASRPFLSLYSFCFVLRLGQWWRVQQSSIRRALSKKERKQTILRCTLFVSCSDWDSGGGCSRVLFGAPQQEGAQADHSFVVLFLFRAQIGTVVEGAAEFYSARLSKKERKQTIGQELLSDANLKHYRQVTTSPACLATALYSTVYLQLCCNAEYNPALYSALQYCTVHYSTTVFSDRVL